MGKTPNTKLPPQPQPRKPPLPLGHKPRRRRTRKDDLRAAVRQSWETEPALDEVDDFDY